MVRWPRPPRMVPGLVTEFSHDDNLVVAVPFWTLREAPSLAAAVVYQQLRFWGGYAVDGRPRSASRGWSHERGDVVWLAIPDDAWAEVGLSPDQLYRARKALADAKWIEAKRMKVDGRPVACVRVVGRDTAADDATTTAESRQSDTANSRKRSTAPARNPHLVETGETGETPSAAEATERDLATAVVNRWWESLTPRPPDNYIGLVKIVEKLIHQGWSQRQVFDALCGGSNRTAAGLDAWMRRGGRTPDTKARRGYAAIHRARDTDPKGLAQ